MAGRQLDGEAVREMWRRGDWRGIEAARTEGRLRAVMGVPAADIELVDEAAEGRLDRGQVRALIQLGRFDLVTTAQREGRIDYPGGDAA